MHIKLYNSTNQDSIKLTLGDISEEQLIMPFMTAQVAKMSYILVQNVGGVETVLDQGSLSPYGFYLTHFVIDENILHWYLNGSLWKELSVTPATYDKVEFSSDSLAFVDEMLFLPYSVDSEDIAGWYGANKAFIDQREINYYSSRVRQLANSYTLTIEGDGIVTGFESLTDPDGISRFTVQADKFKIVGTKNGEPFGQGKAVFEVDTSTDDEKIYLNSDVILKGNLVQSSGGGDLFPVPVYLGEYLPTRTYHRGDSVSYAGAVWLYTKTTPSSGNTPEIGSQYWDLYSARGVDGEPGAKGDQGPGIVFRGNWQEDETYYYTDARRDVVKYNDVYWLFNIYNPNGVKTTSWQGTTQWTNFGATLESIATKMVLVDGQLLLDNEGITMQPTSYPYRSMHLDGAQLGFWDKNNLPSVALGDLTKFKQDLTSAGMLNLFPSNFTFPQYGFLMAQGNIALARSVLAHSLMEIPADLLLDGSIQNKKLAPNAVTNYNVAPKAISLDKLADNIHVPNVDKMTLRRLNNTTVSEFTGADISTSWEVLRTISFNKRFGSYFAERAQIEWVFEWRESNTVYIELLFNNNVIFSKSYTGSTDINQVSVTILADWRSVPEGGTMFVMRARRNSTSYSSFLLRLVRFTVYQNEQYPLRVGEPIYTLETGSTSGCYTGCEVSCETSCQASCQGSCEVSCEDTCEMSCMSGCQTSCQATCEKTSQSGGGCIRAGTPIDVWDLEEQSYTTIPVEDLKPGMILPWYQPETDTVVHGELTQLVDASYSREFLRIRTNNGPSLDVTFEQPFDVLADMGQGLKWYKLQAMYLRPGMQMVRPFDSEPLSTIVGAETVRENGVHFWNPKTTTGGYCVNGYADMLVKL